MVSLDDPRARAAYADAETLPRMSFGDHLDELRRRLLRSLLALAIAIAAMLPFKTEVQGVILEPYRILWRQAFLDHIAALELQQQQGTLDAEYGQRFLANCLRHRDAILAGTFPKSALSILPTVTGFPVPYTLVAIGGLEDFWTYMMASFVFAFVLASPIVLWQMWAFIAAGLYRRERTVFYRFFPFAMALLTAGVLFGFYVAVPYGLGWLIRMMNPDQVSAMLSVSQYFTLMFTLTAAMGLVFQLPLVMVALQRVGLVRHQTYTKHWRVCVLAIVALAAVLTPPDPFSMLLMAAPTLCLYVLGLCLTAVGKKHESPELALPEAGAGP